jgi:predicted nucleotidyltransferase
MEKIGIMSPVFFPVFFHREKVALFEGRKMEQILIDLKKRLQEVAGDRLLRVVLYGSRARGDYSEGSDTDIAVIVRGLTREMKDTMLNRVADIEFDHLRSLSTLILSEEDFIFLKSRERRIALDIEREGIPI